jgi:hypothetical protein
MNTIDDVFAKRRLLSPEFRIEKRNGRLIIS